MRKLVVILFLFSQTAFTQNDSVKAINNFYLEISAGPGIYNSKEGYFNYLASNSSNELTINLMSKFYYKNKRFRGGVNYGYLFAWSGYIFPIYAMEAGLNLFSKDAYPQYLGPSIAYGGIYRKVGTSLGHRFVKFGLDYFYNKFHVAANYQWIAFENAPFRKGDFKTTNIYLEVGYSFNLESFKKKK